MRSPSSFVLLAVLATCVGAAAGITATMVSSRAIDSYAARLLAEQRFTALIPERTVTRPGTYEEALARIRGEGFAASALLVPEVRVSALPSGWQGEKDVVAEGIVVSADGWVVFASDAPFASRRTFAVVIEGKRYAIEKQVAYGDIWAVKLVDAQSLPVSTLGSSRDVRTGDVLFMGDSLQGIVPTTLMSARAPVDVALVRPAEEVPYMWQLADTPRGSFVWNGAGDVVGLLNLSGTVIPLHTFADGLSDILRSGTHARAGFGAYVAQLHTVLNADPALTQGRTHGEVIVAPTPATRAVLLNGPADKAGFLARDIIIALDGVAVNEDRTVADILLTYAPGEIANVTFVRNGETLAVPVTLSDAQELLY